MSCLSTIKQLPIKKCDAVSHDDSNSNPNAICAETKKIILQTCGVDTLLKLHATKPWMTKIGFKAPSFG